MLSPVVQALSVGYFGVDFGWRFTASVSTAHVAFGAVLAGLQPSHGNDAIRPA